MALTHHLAHVSRGVGALLTSVGVDVAGGLLHTASFVLRRQVLVHQVGLLTFGIEKLKVPEVVGLVVLGVTLLGK